MKPALLKQRFEELAKQWEAIEASKKRQDRYFEIVSGDLLNWSVKARNLLRTACRQDSEHYRAFEKAEEPVPYGTNYETLLRLRAVFDAAKEDFEGGYLTSIRGLVQAEVFDNELDQARELLKNGYRTAAAVVAGVVLETSLRQLCTDNNLPIGKLDRMNADLAKHGTYNAIVAKRVTALAGVRNSAAHGNGPKFDDADVDEMIDYIEKFLGDHIS